MKNMFSNAVESLNQVEINKHYDFKTEFKNKNSNEQGLVFQFKGDYTIKPTTVIVAALATAITCSCSALIMKIHGKNK